MRNATSFTSGTWVLVPLYCTWLYLNSYVTCHLDSRKWSLWYLLFPSRPMNNEPIHQAHYQNLNCRKGMNLTSSTVSIDQLKIVCLLSINTIQSAVYWRNGETSSLREDLGFERTKYTPRWRITRAVSFIYGIYVFFWFEHSASETSNRGYNLTIVRDSYVRCLNDRVKLEV